MQDQEVNTAKLLSVKEPREVAIFNQFKTPRFLADVDLLGAVVDFTFRGHRICISLPKKEDLVELPKEARAIVNISQMKDGKNVPLSCYITDIDCWVFWPNKVPVYPEMLTNYANLFGSVPQTDQKGFETIIDKGNLIAEAAFAHWVRTIRWKTGNGGIARHRARGITSSFGPRMVDAKTGWHVWLAPSTITAAGGKPATVQQWLQVASSLQQGISPPIFYDRYFDACEWSSAGELERAIIDAAVACESFLRILILNSLPSTMHESFIKYIDQANIRQVIEHLTEAALTPPQLASFQNDIKSTLHNLFNDRNTVLHSGTIDDLTPEKCEKYLTATLKLLSLTDT